MSTAKQPGGFDHAVEVILIGLLAYLPFAFGGVLPSSHFVVAGAAIGMAICLGFQNLLGKEPHFVWSLAYLPIAAFVALVALQLVPLPIGFLSAIAPGTAEIWKAHLGDVPGASIESATLSLQPLATWTDLRLLLSGAVIFVVVVNVYRTRVQVRRLLLAISMIGVGVVALAFFQHMSGSRSVFWIFDLPSAARHGTFVHYGHFSQFVNLSIGCAIALLLARVAARHAGRRLRLSDVHHGLTERYRRLDLVLVAFVVLAIVAIALSRSRNGLISVLVASVVVTTALHWSGFLTGFGWSLAGIALAAFGVLLALGFDPVYERMATIDAPSDLDGRLAILRDALSAWSAHPILGTGQGTFEWTFPMFDESTRRGTAQHAENQYAEFLVETGVVGFILILATVLLFARSAWRAIRGESSGAAAVTFGLAFGVVAVFFHAGTDFGLRIPAIAVLIVVVMGVLVALVSPAVKVSGGSRIASVLFCLAPAGLLAATLPDALAAVQAERVWRSVEKAQERLAPEFAGTPAEFENLVDLTRQAMELQPGNIQYRYWHAMHGWHLALAKRGEALEAGNPPPTDLPDLARETQKALLESVPFAPTHGPTWASAGDLGVGWIDDPKAGRWVHRGMRLAPHHANICLATGRQFLVEGNVQEAAKAFRRSVHMGMNWQVVESMLLDQLGRPNVAREVARGNPEWLIWLAGRIEKQLGEARAKEDPMLLDVREETRVLMTKLSREPNPPAWVFAGLAREYLRRGDDAAAVEHLRDYLIRIPRSHDRLLFAEALVRLKRIDDARKELERHLRSHPNDNTARRMLRDLRLK